MNIDVTGKKIRFKKEKNKLDTFVITFTSLLNTLAIQYVIVSGYVAILFGRNRTSEDVDIFVEKIDFQTFQTLWDKIIADDFYCINTKHMKDAYEKYLCEGVSLRFAKRDTFIPNIEFKFPKTEVDAWTIQERVQVMLNHDHFYISPVELQIPFKLYLGSEKDIEDAKFLYGVFQEKLDMILLRDFNRKLKTQHLFQRYIQ